MSASPPGLDGPLPRSDWTSPANLHSLLLIGITAIGVYLCLRMLAPFLAVLAWALALAVLFAPLQRWLERRLKTPSLAALVAVLLICVIVVIPAIAIIQQLLLQVSGGVGMLDEQLSSGAWRKSMQAQPQLAVLVDRFERQFDLPGAVKGLSGWLSTTAGSILRGSLVQLVGVVLTFYLLFFLLRDRYAARQALRALSPLSGAEMNKLFGRIADTIHATLYGTLLVSALQGLLGGLMFWWLGLSAPLLWGLVMAVLAVVPVLGAFVVWVPACLWLMLEGSWGKALVLALWGMLVVGTADNLLRPILVGSRLQLHTLLAFLSVVGGLLVFGTAGLILGPVTLTLTTVLLEIWAARARAERSQPASPAP